MTHFYILVDKLARHFNFGLQIERENLHVLKFCSVEVHLWSRDLLQFWEMSANISETVQDNVDILLQWKTNMKSRVSDRMAPISMSYFNVTLAVIKPF